MARATRAAVAPSHDGAALRVVTTECATVLYPQACHPTAASHAPTTCIGKCVRRADRRHAAGCLWRKHHKHSSPRPRSQLYILDENKGPNHIYILAGIKLLTERAALLSSTKLWHGPHQGADKYSEEPQAGGQADKGQETSGLRPTGAGLANLGHIHGRSHLVIGIDFIKVENNILPNVFTAWTLEQ